MGIKVGIDLGTTFSAVAMMDEKKGQPVIIPNTDGELITPSVIQFAEGGEIIVGSEAKDSFEAGEEGCVSVFKRGMGGSGPYCYVNGKGYTAVELSAILLRHLKEEAEKVTGQKIDEAVVTVPAYFFHKERGATMEAARKAGLKVRQIINEPTAAALTYGVNHWRENACVMVYDLGGGTFDVTIVQMKKNNQLESLKTTGNHTLGGKDWDARLCSLLEQKVEANTGVLMEEHPEVRQAINQAAEGAKKQLTTRNSALVKLRLPEYGWYSAAVTLEEFEEATVDLIERTGTLCESLLKELGISWRGITDILLVGGSTRMRQVSSYLKNLSGHTPLCQVNPDEAVALGAAIQVHLPLPEYSVMTAPPAEEPKRGFGFKRQPPAPAPIRSGAVGRETALADALSVSQSDVVAHAMGVIAVSEDGKSYINRTIIPANQKIPVKCAEAFQFYTSAGGENELEIYMLQGVKAPLDCEVIGKYVAYHIRHDRAHNPTRIRIQYSYDVNGMVHVQARQEDDEVDLPIREEPVVLADMEKFGRPVEAETVKAAEPLSLVMAVDVSGSMEGKPLEDALEAMGHFIESFENYPGRVEIGLIAVSNDSQIVQSMTSDLKRCRKSLNAIKCGMTGYCNEGHPFDDIQRMLRNAPGRRFAMVLADGVWDDQPTAVAAARKCHQKEIEITGIGFGSADKKFLQDISSGDVEAMLVQQSELTQSFGKIAQAIGGGSQGKKGRSGGETAVSTWRAVDE